MLEAERAGLQAMHEAGAIRVPRPICGGDGPGGKYLWGGLVGQLSLSCFGVERSMVSMQCLVWIVELCM